MDAAELRRCTALMLFYVLTCSARDCTVSGYQSYQLMFSIYTLSLFHVAESGEAVVMQGETTLITTVAAYKYNKHEDVKLV